MILAIIIITGLSLGFGLLLSFAAIRFKVEGDPLVEQIDAILPQTQCGKCNYPGCRPYAEAIAAGEAPINQCPPGGEAGIQALATLLDREIIPLNAENGSEKPKAVAVIREDTCIGCTLCIQACPVDAIVGAAKRMHTVIEAECTGCDLCVEPCPVDCIDMLPVKTILANWKVPSRYFPNNERDPHYPTYARTQRHGGAIMLALLPQLWRFNGGIKPGENKVQALQNPIESLATPQYVQVPLHQHIGVANEVQVSVGQAVYKGQVLATARGAFSVQIHAPTSGTVVRIGSMPVPHASGLPAQCVQIETDGKDQWIARDAHPDFRILTPQAISTIVQQSGVVGLGGALFPTAVKLAAHPKPVDTLIINAAECEPYISCDQALVAARAGAIISGIEITRCALQARRVLLGIEENKPAAITALRAVLEHADKAIELCIVPTRYPTGGERQLVKVLTGKEVPAGGLPADIGIRVINVATAYAIHRAVCLGEPLISRIVTVSGDGVKQPANLEVLIGTPIADLIAHCGGYLAGVAQLTMGGPMMGFALPNDTLPVLKSTNCLIASTTQALPAPQPEQPCIRCGDCVQVCPANLLPQQLYWYAKARDLPKLEHYNLADCIECGACAYVCPSHIPLVHHYRYAKSEIREQARNREQSETARQRFEAREARLARLARGKEAKMAQKRAALEASKKAAKEKHSSDSTIQGQGQDKQDVIAAALARAQAKKAASAKPLKNTHDLSDTQQAQIAQTDKRRAHKTAGDTREV